MNCYVKIDPSIFHADYIEISQESITTENILKMIEYINSKEDPEKQIIKSSHQRKILDYMNYPYEDIGDIRNMDIISFLYGHKKVVISKGSEYSDRLFAKLYFAEEPDPDADISRLRSMKFASYINYGKQIEKQSGKQKIIYDENEVCGLWAFDANKIVEYLDTGCYTNHNNILDHYGTRILILKTIPDEDYYKGSVEIIGSKYYVIKDFNLYDTNDLLELDVFLHGISTDFSSRMIRELQSVVEQKFWTTIDHINILYKYSVQYEDGREAFDTCSFIVSGNDIKQADVSRKDWSISKALRSEILDMISKANKLNNKSNNSEELIIKALISNESFGLLSAELSCDLRTQWPEVNIYIYQENNMIDMTDFRGGLNNEGDFVLGSIRVDKKYRRRGLGHIMFRLFGFSIPFIENNLGHELRIIRGCIHEGADDHTSISIPFYHSLSETILPFGKRMILVEEVVSKGKLEYKIQ